ncbi:sugar ABC transporter permease [Caloramator sp. CAR-1]|uniref:sugar ABC transporter permease n=1 Tax=Caloramator sp. CAR-1 TaxID=3062777 RepID=UPI0026E373EB|nr:sugar ABC transporter permease [Caloramator sp. CAR-1]MDO6354728.1 sugar ABC transporter permease [Caloramator sp. CAR-1]
MRIELKNTKNIQIKKHQINIKTYMLIIALICIWAIFTLTTKGDFLTARNISNLLRQMAVTGILATGMVFVIIAGQIDLSVGSMLGLLGGIAAILNVWHNINGILTILITLVIGILLGIWNGFWVAYKKVPAFIVTLAGMLIFRGALIGITKGSTIAPLTSEFKFIGQAYLTKSVGIIIGILFALLLILQTLKERKEKIQNNIPVPKMTTEIMNMLFLIVFIAILVLVLNKYQGIPVPVFIMFIIAIIFNFIAKKTVFGRRVYALGGNSEAARLSGINVDKLTMILFAINGLLAAIGGILLTSRLNAASVAAGQNAELDAIASCVIGGASLMGGVGTVSGALIGALVMASIDNGMSMLNTQPFWQYVVKGLILLIAVWIDMESKNKN